MTWEDDTTTVGAEEVIALRQGRRGNPKKSCEQGEKVV